MFDSYDVRFQCPTTSLNTSNIKNAIRVHLFKARILLHTIIMSSNELSEKGSESMRITMNLTRGGGQPHSRPQGANLAGRVTVQVTGVSKMEMKI